jgi:AhpD family alkylhydroperoxidase
MSRPLPRPYRLPTLLAQAAGLARRAPALAEVFVGPSLAPARREAIMLGVAYANACRYCAFVHGRWARKAGLPEADAVAIEQGRFDALDPDLALAVRYGKALADADFGPIDDDLFGQVDARFGAGGRAAIEATARFMTLANRAGNTLDALLARLQGQPVPGSTLPSDLAIGLPTAAIVPVVGAALAPWFGRTPWAFAREFMAFSKGFRVAGE